jgi:hypothetical protein
MDYVALTAYQKLVYESNELPGSQPELSVPAVAVLSST